MLDPLFGSIWGPHSTIHIRDDRRASPEEPGILVDVGSGNAELNLAQLASLITTLRQAQMVLIERKDHALRNRTLPLF
jgi:hypothetical protein